MSDTPRDAASPQDSREFDTARRTLFEVLERGLAERGSPEAAPYVHRMFSPRHAETVTTPSGYRVVRMRVFGRFSTYTARHDARTGEQRSMTLGALIKDGGRDLTREEAVRIATSALQPPEGAQLEVAEYDEAAGQPFFFLRWAHLHGGVRVEKDHLHVMLNGKSRRIFSWSRRWHAVSTEPVPR